MLCGILGTSRSALCASVNDVYNFEKSFVFIISFSLLPQQLLSSCLQFTLMVVVLPVITIMNRVTTTKGGFTQTQQESMCQ